jgi:hypothetical protein
MDQHFNHFEILFHFLNILYVKHLYPRGVLHMEHFLFDPFHSNAIALCTPSTCLWKPICGTNLIMQVSSKPTFLFYSTNEALQIFGLYNSTMHQTKWQAFGRDSTQLLRFWFLMPREKPLQQHQQSQDKSCSRLGEMSSIYCKILVLCSHLLLEPSSMWMWYWSFCVWRVYP